MHKPVEDLALKDRWITPRQMLVLCVVGGTLTWGLIFKLVGVL